MTKSRQQNNFTIFTVMWDWTSRFIEYQVNLWNATGLSVE